MKHMKKFMALFAALALVLTMAIPAMAASIKIDGTGKTYKAYKLLNATVSGDKVAYTVNVKYQTALQTVTGKSTDKEIVAYINGFAANSTQLNAFAEAVYDKIKSGEADYTTTNNTFADVAQGYYLIAETEVADGGTDTYSLLMLDTAGENDLTVKSKESVPQLEKKIQEKNDSTGAVSGWQDGADYDVNDKIPFKLTGTVSANYDSYKTYKYVFHDKMSAGLTFDPASVKVSVDGTVVTDGFTVVTTGFIDDCTFEVRFDDLKTIPGATVKSTSKITVEYTATLNSKAVIGSAGNTNEAKLEYANNPYGAGTGKTPWDKVIAFTYKLTANKVDKNGDPVDGAGFTLYKYNNDTNSYEAVGAELKGDDTNPMTQFVFDRIDAGKYKLVETTVPAGYNKADDLEFEVAATYDTDKNDPVFGTLVIKDLSGKVLSEGTDKVFTVDVSNGSAVTSIVNLSGTILPGTGGIGTTIFYVIGGLLMAAAAVLLITKKRMNSDK